jgi:hypothetical protein
MAPTANSTVLIFGAVVILGYVILGHIYRETKADWARLLMWVWPGIAVGITIGLLWAP